MNNPQQKKGMCPKLVKQWEGLYNVANRVNDVLYQVQRGPRKTPKLVHKDRLRQYRGVTDNQRCPGSGKTTLPPQEVACVCYTELVVRDTAINSVLHSMRQRSCCTACLGYIVGRESMPDYRSV